MLAALGDLLPDVEGWLAQVTERQSGERDRLEAERDRALGERDEAARKLARAEARWLEMDDADQELVKGALRTARTEVERAETRLSATEDALAAVPAETPTDALLDFAAALQRALRGVDTSGTMAQVNAALAEVHEGFLIWREPCSCDPEDDAVMIEPVLHMGVARA